RWPGEVVAGVVFYSDERPALDFVRRVRRMSLVSQWRGPLHARLLEFFDNNSLALLRRQGWPGVSERAKAAILLEQESGDDSPEDIAERWIATIEETQPPGSALLEDSWFATSPASRDEFRKFRHAIALIVNETARQNGYPKLGTDQA